MASIFESFNTESLKARAIHFKLQKPFSPLSTFNSLISSWGGTHKQEHRYVERK